MLEIWSYSKDAPRRSVAAHPRLRATRQKLQQSDRRCVPRGNKTRGVAGLGRAAVHTASGALPSVFRALASQSLLFRRGHACARPLLWPLLALVASSAHTFERRAEPSAPRANQLATRPPPAPVSMAGRDMKPLVLDSAPAVDLRHSRELPQEVLENIHAFLPRDRTCSSATASALKGRRRLTAFRFNSFCAVCRNYTRDRWYLFDSSSFEDDDGFRGRPRCSTCRERERYEYFRREDTRRLNFEFMRPYLGE
jgi:hypothetical protein